MTKRTYGTVAGVPSTREEVSAAELDATGVDWRTEFPGASAAEFRRYPVLSEGGWHIVLKHQPTLRTVLRERWKLLGPIRLTSDGIDF